MAYNRALKPVFYPCTMNWMRSRGVGTFSKIAGTYNGTPNDYELIDMKPSNRVSFDTSDNATTHIVLQFNTGVTSNMNINFCAILNHNLVAADGKIRIAYHTSALAAGTGTTVTVLNTGDTPLVNGSVSTNIVTPATNGSTIINFTEVSDKQYWAIEIEDISSFSATDLEIGTIVLGEAYVMPTSPDLSVSRNIVWDGVDVQTAAGGGEFGNARYITGLDGTASYNHQPFRDAGAGSAFRSHGGRWNVGMNFSYLSDSDLMQSDITSGSGSDTVLHDIFNKTAGRLKPFVFGVDSTSTTVGDYMFARFANDGMETNQVAHNTWSAKMNVRETW